MVQQQLSHEQFGRVGERERVYQHAPELKASVTIEPCAQMLTWWYFVMWGTSWRWMYGLESVRLVTREVMPKSSMMPASSAWQQLSSYTFCDPSILESCETVSEGCLWGGCLPVMVATTDGTVDKAVNLSSDRAVPFAPPPRVISVRLICDETRPAKDQTLRCSHGFHRTYASQYRQRIPSDNP